MPSPASEIQQYSLGTSWLESPVCKRRSGGSGRQHIEYESAKLFAVRKAHCRLDCTNQPAAQGKWLSPTAQPLWSHDQFWVPNAKEILKNWKSPEEGNHDLEGAGVLDMQGKAEETGCDQPEGWRDIC